jgi:hypothetical protein
MQLLLLVRSYACVCATSRAVLTSSHVCNYKSLSAALYSLIATNKHLLKNRMDLLLLLWLPCCCCCCCSLY